MGAAIGRGSTQSLVAGSHEAGVGWSGVTQRWRIRAWGGGGGGRDVSRRAKPLGDEERGVCVCVGDWTGDDEIAKIVRCGVRRSTDTRSKVAPNYIQFHSFYYDRDSLILFHLHEIFKKNM